MAKSPMQPLIGFYVRTKLERGFPFIERLKGLKLGGIICRIGGGTSQAIIPPVTRRAKPGQSWKNSLAPF